MVISRIIITTIFLLTSPVIFAQITLKGLIKLNPEGEQAALAHVSLIDILDDTQLYVTLCDLNGEYEFADLPLGKYELKAKFVGYNQLVDTVIIRLPSAGKVVYKNYSLEINKNEIGAVVVTHNNIEQFIDRTTYNITKSDLKNKTDALDLMNVVPHLHIDPVTQRIVNFRGSIRVLVNGANASEEDLRGLEPDQVKSIDYYDFPPARFAGYGTVVNIITKEVNEGISGGINLQHAFYTGFNNDVGYFKYNKGAHQISASYSMSYRNYKKVQSDTEYAYSLSGINHQRIQTDYRKFGYTDNYIAVNYVYHKIDRHLFQVSFYPNHQHVHNDAKKTIRNIRDQIEEDRYGAASTRTKQFTPSSDIYLWKQLSSTDELIMNIVATYHDAQRKYQNQEKFSSTDLLIIDDAENLKSKKYSIIGELTYIRSFKSSSLLVGNKVFYEDLTSTINNSFNDSSYGTKVFSEYFFSEFSGKIKRWMYRFTLGVNYTYLKNHLDKDINWVFTPRAMLGYELNPFLTLRVGFAQTNTRPSLSQLSENASYIDENIISRGNPLLKSGYSNESFLNLIYNRKAFTAYLSGSYSYNQKPVNSYFVESGNNMVLTYENAHKSYIYGAYYGITVNPLKDNFLILKIEGNVTRRSIFSNFTGKYRYTSAPLFCELTLNYKKFTAFYQGNIVTFTLDGPYLRSDEEISNIGIRYNHKNFSANITCMWFLKDATYKTKTIPSSSVYYNFRNTISNNASMITLGISYRFSKGKIYNEKQKLLDNRDIDTGI